MNRSMTPTSHGQSGFSLIELMFAMALFSIVVTLGAFAARQFWFQRALIRAQDDVTVQLRNLQQRVVAEGVSGRYHGAWFDPDSSNWGTVRYQSGTCTSTGTFSFDAGVEVDSITAATTGAEVNFGSPTDVAATCRSQLSQVPDTTDVKFVWFLSRGIATATSGDHIQLIQPRRDNRIEQVRVVGLTGRVEKV